MKSIALDSHLSVIDLSTPFGEFTNWCLIPHTAEVDIQDLRRKALRSYIEDVLKTTVNDFSRKIGRESAGFFYEVLSGKRAFRESLAEKLEKLIVKNGLTYVDLRKPGPNGGKAPAVEESWPWPFQTPIKDYMELGADDRKYIEETIEDRVRRSKEGRGARRAAKKNS